MSEFLKPLYEVNQQLIQNKKLYIWGYHEAASGLFVKLCALSVRVAGFISDAYAGAFVWNKPVLSTAEIDTSDSVVCIADDRDLEKENIKEYTLCRHSVVLHSEFDKRQAVIYGAGKTGRQVLSFLQSAGIEVLCFIDSDKVKIGERIENILIMDVTFLAKLPESAYVVEAGYCYREMEETISKYIGAKKRFYWEKPFDNLRLSIVRGLDIFLPDMMGFQECFKGRKYYLYGSDTMVLEECRDVLDLLGIETEIVSDDVDSTNVECLEELVYEDNYLILVAEIKKKKEIIYKLELLGMHEGIEYVDIRSPFVFYSLSRISMPDLNLSYTYLMDDKYPGFKVLGKNRELDYRIVLLGGSTTDGGIGIYKSWAEFLFEKCEGYDVTLWNGGISGYTATQELIKLLRDVLGLNPDMIIVYDGVNDANNNYKGSPYRFKYLEQTVSPRKTKGSLQDDNYSQHDIDYLSSEESFDIWLNNIEIMYAIAQSKGIRFFSFLQPMLVSKKESFLTERERGYIGICSLCYKRYMLDGRKYRKLMKERNIIDTHSYIFDLSDIFDEHDVYLDVCHVNEEGNKIIADKVWEKVNDYIVNIFNTKL